VDFSPIDAEGTFAEFSCGSTSVSVRGSAIALVSQKTAARTLTYAFAAPKAKQKPEHLIGMPTDVLESSVAGAPFARSGLISKVKSPNYGDLQVNPVV
jgi:hypothetical protein